MASPCFIGTSGWRYDHWVGPFYPESDREDGFSHLDFYARRLPAVEINNSFYQLPSEETLDRWRDATPEGFRFAAKASRHITHMKKLKDPEETLPPFVERLKRLGDRLGPLLFQLPPNWRFNPDRLDAFLAALPGEFRCAIEFRDPSWHDDRALAALERAGVAFCIYELAGHSFNLNSPQQLGGVLFKELQLPGGKKTKSGYSTEAPLLEALRCDY
ncbi:MAG: DNA polymerase, partial [Desulfococcaceae bacterium]